MNQLILDIETLEALEMFMNKYPGIILFTSHDTRFVKHVSDKMGINRTIYS